MHHPEQLLIPILMLSDYQLTVAGARQRDRGYAAHLRTPQYELNPLWQRAIAAKRWFNPRHLVLTLLVATTLLASTQWLLAEDDPIIPMVTGALFAVLGAINGRHLSNIAIFIYVEKHPGSINGTLAMTHAFMLWLSTFQLLTLLLPLALLAACFAHPAIIGAVLGIGVLCLVHLAWIWRARRRS